MRTWLLSAALIAGCLVGCDSKKDETPGTPPTAPVTPKPTPTAADAAAAIPKVLPATPDAAAPNPVPTTPAPAAQSATPPAPAAQIASDASTGAQASAVDVQAKAQSLMTQVTDYIKQNKLDDAQSAMTKLKALEAKLPASWQQKIQSAQDALTAAKTGSSFKNALNSELSK